MAHAKNHDYHILAPSIEPLLGAVAAFIMLFGGVLWMHGITPFVFLADSRRPLVISSTDS